MEKIKHLKRIQKALLHATIEKNLEDNEISCGKFTPKGLQIISKKEEGARAKVLGYLQIDAIEEYFEEGTIELSWNINDLFQKLFKDIYTILGKEVDVHTEREADRLYETTLDSIERWGNENARSLRFESLALPEDDDDAFFPLGDDQQISHRIDTRILGLNEYILNDFWSEFERGYHPLVDELKECKNVVVTHYKGKRWQIYKRYHRLETMRTWFYDTCDADIEGIFYDITRSEGVFPKLDLLKEYFKSNMSRFSNLECYGFASEKEIQRDFQRAKKAIIDSANSVSYDSAIENVKDLFDFHYFGAREYQDVSDALCSCKKADRFLKKFKKQKGEEAIYDAYRLSEVIFEACLNKNKTSIAVGDYRFDFIKKAKAFIEAQKSYFDEFELEFDEHYQQENCIKTGSWILKSEGYEYHLPWTVANEELLERVLSHAINSLRMRINEFNREAEKAERRMEKFQEAREDSEKFFITLQDSYNAGNCEVGTLNFCRRHQIDTSKVTQIRGDELLGFIEKETYPDDKDLAISALIVAHMRFKRESVNH